MQYYTNVYWRNITVYFLVNPKFKSKKFQAARVPKVSKFSLLKSQFPLGIPTDFGPFLLILRASRSDEFVSAAKKKKSNLHKEDTKTIQKETRRKEFSYVADQNRSTEGIFSTWFESKFNVVFEYYKYCRAIENRNNGKSPCLDFCTSFWTLFPSSVPWISWTTIPLRSLVDACDHHRASFLIRTLPVCLGVRLDLFYFKSSSTEATTLLAAHFPPVTWQSYLDWWIDWCAVTTAVCIWEVISYIIF